MGSSRGGREKSVTPRVITPIPGPQSRALAAELRRYESRNSTFLAEDFPIFWERAEGTNVWDADGNRLLDLTSAFGVAGLGHSPPAVREALTAQAGELLHAMGDVHPAAIKARLCRELSAITFEKWGAGVGKAILGNSGFEAVEAALKTAMIATGKPGVIAFHGAYHGLGYGALGVGGLPFFREPFRRQLGEFAMLLPYGDADIESVVEQGGIGCVLVEPIQGRGGIVVPPPDFLPALRAACDRHGLLLITDEIYTGLNRTGVLFACDHAGVVPDIVCLGKALTSGFPLSACVGRAAVMDAWPESAGEALHTSTFLGNPLGCAMALASLALHRAPGLAAQVAERGEFFKKAILELRSPRIAGVRGRGLMLGVEIVDKRGEPDGAFAVQLMKRALAEGLILLTDGPDSSILSLTPPFAISDEEIACVVDFLRRA